MDKWTFIHSWYLCTALFWWLNLKTCKLSKYDVDTLYMYIQYANGDTVRMQYTFPIYIVVCPPVKGQQNRWSFGSRPPTAEVRQKGAMPKHLVFWASITWNDIPRNQLQQRNYRESAIHRLSAVGLPRSLRAGNCGPYNRWLKKTVAITHSHLLDMPPHQLPARSQILHRVSILVEAKPQNWDLAHPDDLRLPREED